MADDPSMYAPFAQLFKAAGLDPEGNQIPGSQDVLSQVDSGQLKIGPQPNLNTIAGPPEEGVAGAFAKFMQQFAPGAGDALSDLGSAVMNNPLSNAVKGLFGGGAPQAQQQAGPGAPGGGPQKTLAQYAQGAPREAAQSGTLMGFIDHLMGVPTKQQVILGARQQGIDQDMQQKAQVSDASRRVLQRLSTLQQENPKAPPQMIRQMLFQDPIFMESVMKADPGDMVEMVTQMQEALVGGVNPAKLQNVPAGNDVITMDPSSPTGVRKVYTNTNPTGSAKRDLVAVPVMGGSPQAKALGLEGLKEGSQFTAEVETLEDGSKVARKLHYAGALVNMPDAYEMQQMNELIKRGTDIRKAQSNIMSMIESANRIEALLKDGGGQNLSAVGLANRVGDAALSQIKSGAQELGITLDPTSYSATFKNLEKNSKLKNAAINAQAVQSNLIALSFQIARSYNHGQTTQKDVQTALDALGGWLTSPEQLRAGLNETVRRGIRSVENDLVVNRNLFDNPKSAVRAPESLESLLTSRGLGRYLTDQLPGLKGGADVPGEQKRVTSGEDVTPRRGAIEATEPTKDEPAVGTLTPPDKNGQRWRYKGGGGANWRTDKKFWEPLPERRQ